MLTSINGNCCSSPGGRQRAEATAGVRWDIPVRTQARPVRRACAGGPPAPSWWDTGPRAEAQGTWEVMPAAGEAPTEAPRRVLGTGHMEPGGGQDRAKMGPDAEPSLEAHRPGDGAQQLSSWSRRKGSPAWSARGRSQHGCQALEGRKAPLKQETSALPARGAMWQTAGGAEPGEEGRRLRIFLREGQPPGEGKRQESGWVKINTNTQAHSGKGHGAHSGDCEPEPRSVNPGRPAGTGDSIRPSGQQLSLHGRG